VHVHVCVCGRSQRSLLRRVLSKNSSRRRHQSPTTRQSTAWTDETTRQSMAWTDDGPQDCAAAAAALTESVSYTSLSSSRSMVMGLRSSRSAGSLKSRPSAAVDKETKQHRSSLVRRERRDDFHLQTSSHVDQQQQQQQPPLVAPLPCATQQQQQPADRLDMSTVIQGTSDTLTV